MRLSRLKMLCYRSLVKDNRASDVEEGTTPLASGLTGGDSKATLGKE